MIESLPEEACVMNEIQSVNGLSLVSGQLAAKPTGPVSTKPQAQAQTQAQPKQPGDRPLSFAENAKVPEPKHGEVVRAEAHIEEMPAGEGMFNEDSIGEYHEVEREHERSDQNDSDEGGSDHGGAQHGKGEGWFEDLVESVPGEAHPERSAYEAAAVWISVSTAALTVVTPTEKKLRAGWSNKFEEQVAMSLSQSKKGRVQSIRLVGLKRVLFTLLLGAFGVAIWWFDSHEFEMPVGLVPATKDPSLKQQMPPLKINE